MTKPQTEKDQDNFEVTNRRRYNRRASGGVSVDNKEINRCAALTNSDLDPVNNEKEREGEKETPSQESGLKQEESAKRRKLQHQMGNKNIEDVDMIQDPTEPKEAEEAEDMGLEILALN